MSGKKTVYYWDSCVYVAWLKQESAHADYLDSINAIIESNKNGQCTIITSTITMTEVLSTKFDNNQQEREFVDCFSFKKHLTFDVDPPVAMKARELRDYYISNPITDRKLLAPDAIHLATAIIYTASEFHTFDNGESKDNQGKKGIPLLDLGSKVGTYSLKICKPFMPHESKLI
ncbi:MAG: PIN domain-containing protein [Blastochloris sp.]|nr:PIN domain-containing protein [Blastochloris sp.]